MFAHLVGIPVEETALSLAPIAAATGGLAGMKLRGRVARRRSRHRRNRAAAPAASGAAASLPRP